MLNYSELKKGTRIIYKGAPYEIVEASAMFKARGSSSLQVKIKNLITGNIVADTFHSSDSFEEADLSKLKAKFIYHNKGKFIFSEADNPQERFELDESQLANISKFLKEGETVEAIIFKDEIINISLPVKIELKVDQSPPGVKGNRAQSGNKVVTLETGAELNVPLFIAEGDIIEINTEKGEYVRRIEKK